jgi:RNA polymerase sigma factor (sigma-70 family)
LPARPPPRAGQQDAEDAFQATFLTLARKGHAVTRGGSVGGWLYTVAYRAALTAKARAARRPAAVPLADVPAPSASPAADWCDVRPVLDEEIGRLPDRYRVPFVLCNLEGLTVDEAARRLGRPRGTIGTRLARARERLRNRLAGRGIGLSALALTSVLANEATARLPIDLVTTALRLASAGAVAPGPVLTLTEGVLRAMFLSQLKTGMAAVAAVTALGLGGLTVHTLAADGPAGGPAPAAAAPAERLTFQSWGTAVDPDGDCKFTVTRDALTIAVPGSDHVLGVERGRMNAPRVLQPVTGDFVTQVRVSADFPKEAKTLVPQRRPLFVAGLLLYVDDGTYVRLERADPTADGAQHHYANWELRRGGAWVRAGGTDDGPIDRAAPAWLRLERRGGGCWVITPPTAWRGRRWNRSGSTCRGQYASGSRSGTTQRHRSPRRSRVCNCSSASRAPRRRTATTRRSRPRASTDCYFNT